MKCECLPDPIHRTATVVDHVRLFRRFPELTWRYRVHEQILPSIRALGGEVAWSDVVIQHVGYQDPALRRRKLERDLRLLGMENGEQPDEPFVLFNLGCIHQELGQVAESLPYLRRSLERSHPGDSIVRKLYVQLASGQRHLGQTAEAQATINAGRHLYPEDTELLFQEGVSRQELRDFDGAERCFQHLLQRPKTSDYFASVDVGLGTFKARHNLAILYRASGREAEAEAQWQAALAEAPDFVPGWVGMVELYLQQRRWHDAEALTHHMSERFPDAIEVLLAKARLGMAQGLFKEAQVTLHNLIEREPTAITPRIFLSHAYLQEGSNWQAAEHALNEVLRLDPGNAEAQHNLAVLQNGNWV